MVQCQLVLILEKKDILLYSRMHQSTAAVITARYSGTSDKEESDKGHNT